MLDLLSGTLCVECDQMRINCIQSSPGRQKVLLLHFPIPVVPSDIVLIVALCSLEYDVRSLCIQGRRMT